MKVWRRKLDGRASESIRQIREIRPIRESFPFVIGAGQDYGFFSSTDFFVSVAAAIIESRLALNSVPGFHVGIVFA